ncbi:MAG: HAD-IA family hydrolase, partial [Thermoanaerobaculales bacterium]|nr:HAD-IA family hydrolase [Thermoanaerobaculales bacterium]
KPRLAGVRGFLESRGIRLPEGDVEEQPPAMTVAGLGNRKNQLFGAMLDSGGVAPLPGARRFVQLTRQRGLRAALVSSSANASRVLAAAGFGDDFDARVDGLVARRLGLAGKPAPDTFLEAARLVDTDPARSVVIEDALVGVAAGRAGRFGLVIGIGSPDQAAALHDHGADIVVSGLSELLPD